MPVRCTRESMASSTPVERDATRESRLEAIVEVHECTLSAVQDSAFAASRRSACR